MQGVVGFLVTTLLAKLPKNLPVKKIGNQLRFYRIVDMSFVASLFWPTQYIICQFALSFSPFVSIVQFLATTTTNIWPYSCTLGVGLLTTT